MSVRLTKKDKEKAVAQTPQASEESPEQPQKNNEEKETMAEHGEDEKENMEDLPVCPKKGKEKEKALLTEVEQVEMEDEIARGLNDVDLGQHEEDKDEDGEPCNKKARTEKEKVVAPRSCPRKQKSDLEECSRMACFHFNVSVHSYSLSNARRSPTQSTTSISTSLILETRKSHLWQASLDCGHDLEVGLH